MKQEVRGYYLALAVTLISVAALLFSVKLLPAPASPYPSLSDVQTWIDSVEKGDMEKAIASAGKILQCRPPSLKPGTDYLIIAGQMKLDPAYFNAYPGKADFLRWESAFVIKGLLSNEFKDKPPSITAMFEFLQGAVRLKSDEEPGRQSDSPAEILMKGCGNTQELTRLLCEMAYQEGFEAQTVSLFNEKGEQLHLLCEFRKAGAVVTVDMTFGKIWAGKSFADLLKDKSSRDGIWPEQIESCIHNYSYGVPAEPQDYKPANQDLYKYVLITARRLDFRFGSDPRERIENYLRFFPDLKTNERFGYWRYPFIVMMANKAQTDK
ncbi:MAG: hypothetical protein WC637_02610 [Victivallales bacterium]|jgi:hypothetical protein